MTVDLVQADLAEGDATVHPRHFCGLDDPGRPVALRNATDFRAHDAAIPGVDTAVDKTDSDHPQPEPQRASANLSGASAHVGR